MNPPPRLWDTQTVRHLVAWPPLMEWIQEHGFDPHCVRSFSLEDEGTKATFEVMLLDAQGRKYVDRRTMTIACEVRTVPTRRLPPWKTPAQLKP